MPGVRRFEELLVWQKARALTAEVYRITEPGARARNHAVVDQLRRAAISIPSNIAEGFERTGARSFLLFLTYARGSCAELRSLLYTALDLGWLAETEFARLQGNAREVDRLLRALQAAQRRAPVTRSR